VKVRTKGSPLGSQAQDGRASSRRVEGSKGRGDGEEVNGLCGLIVVADTKTAPPWHSHNFLFSHLRCPCSLGMVD